MTRFGLLVAAVLLAVDPWGWDRFGPFRWALISTIGFATVAISLGAGDVRLRPLPRWAVLGWLITLGAMVVSTMLSNDRWHALIGTPDRHLGLATWFLFAGLFATASLYPKTAGPSLLRWTAPATLAVGIWAVLEWRSVGDFASNFADDRVGATFGQPAFLGAAMTLVVPLCFALAQTTDQPRIWRAIGALAAVFGLFALGLSASRAAWVGLVVASFILIVRRRSWLVGVFGVVVLGVLLATTSIGDRAATLTEVDTGVVAGRLDEWAVGVDALVDTSTFGIFGYGPEGYRTVFGAHVDELYVITHGREVITDRAHNGLLDTSLSGGLLAGAGVVLLQLGLAVTAVQRLRADDPLDVALCVAVLAYLIQQLFLFPLAELDPVLWILAGLLVARRPQRREQRAPLFTSVSGANRGAMLAAGFLAAVSAVAGMSDVAADHAVKGVTTAESDAVALRAADSARSRRPDSIRYDFIAARAAQRTNDIDGFTAALDRLDDGLTISPHDPALLAERGVVLLEIARRDGERASLDAALDALGALDDTDPRNPATQLTHGIALALDGEIDAAVAELEHAARLRPDAIEAWLNLAIVHFEAGDMASASSALDTVDQLAPENARAQALRREFFSE